MRCFIIDDDDDNNFFHMEFCMLQKKNQNITQGKLERDFHHFYVFKFFFLKNIAKINLKINLSNPESKNFFEREKKLSTYPLMNSWQSSNQHLSIFDIYFFFFVHFLNIIYLFIFQNLSNANTRTHARFMHLTCLLLFGQ